ncbi:MAG: PQQ-dependent sugar dehydrogenase [Woeseiaceae bacterium]|nr:PQQ-dependent sugar dehydrogenase [Woeseiaceae bacterium]
MRHLILTAAALSLAACAQAASEPPFETAEIASFNEPWALAFLPDGRMLVTEKSGQLFVVSESGEKAEIAGVPSVDYGGQGGLGDVTLHPSFAENGIVYLSFAEAGDDDTRGAAISKSTLDLDALELTGTEIIWRQVPKVTGKGHYGHRMLFDDDGYLWVTNGDRQKFDPSQDMQSSMGKILRLNDDGTAAAGNPFEDQGGVTAEIWSLGHRNPLGFDFDLSGQLWNVEMGPRGGDELNLVLRGANYGYPIVSNGRHYSGRDIPDHDTRPEFEEPKAWWTPVISPGNLEIYTADEFPEWKGHALIAGLSSQALVLVELSGDSASEKTRYDMGKRIRSVDQGPNGAVWVLEDKAGGRLLKLTPKD